MINKLVAYGMGLLCHVSFLFAIAIMAYMLATGLTSSILPIGGHFGRLMNIALLFQFPILHSFFLTALGRKILIFPFPKEIARELLSTTYTFVASIQLLVVFLFWTPAPKIWFKPSHLMLGPWALLYCVSWVLLIISLSEAGMAMHTGWLGWNSVVAEKPLIYPRIPTKGLHYQCRHPIYLSFALIILTAPVWGVDHFMLASVWVLYCLIGPKFKEQRIQQRIGAQYETIKQTTPYLIPRSLQISSYLQRIKRL